MMPQAKLETLPSKSYCFDAIGTRWVIDYVLPEGLSRPVKRDIRQLVAAFDKTYSRFRPDSLVVTMSQKPGTYALPYNGSALLDLYDRMFDVSAGKVTPLIGQVLVDLGYDPNYSLVPRTATVPRSWDEITRHDAEVLTLRQPALLDFGAAGKGLLVDLVCGVLEKAGATEYCVDAGGDIRYYSAAGKQLRVGLENPDNLTEAIGVATIGSQSICGSSGSRRKWATYHHIVDPDTLESPRRVKATWTVAETAMLADGMATCLFFVEPETVRRAFSFEYLVVYDDNSFSQSPHFPAQLFTRTEPTA